jgi:HSP20 family protein
VDILKCLTTTERKQAVEELVGQSTHKEGRKTMQLSKRRPETQTLVPVEESRGLLPFEEMERWFDEAFQGPFSLFRRPFFPSRWSGEGVTPAVDFLEDGDEFVVKAELPGMEKNDININLQGDLLTISGEKKKEDKVEEKNYLRIERSSGRFSRSFRLPAEVLSDKATATFTDGILELRLPKSEEAKKKEINIKVE